MSRNKRSEKITSLLNKIVTSDIDLSKCNIKTRFNNYFNELETIVYCPNMIGYSIKHCLRLDKDKELYSEDLYIRKDPLEHYTYLISYYAKNNKLEIKAGNFSERTYKKPTQKEYIEVLEAVIKGMEALIK